MTDTTDELLLSRLVLNLLALAEATPALPVETLRALAPLADELEPTVDGLAPAISAMRNVLRGQPAFGEARTAWQAMLGPSDRLSAGVLIASLGNPQEPPARGVQPLEAQVPPAEAKRHGARQVVVERLASVTRLALQRPREFAQRTDVLEWLASGVKLRWPRESGPA